MVEIEYRPIKKIVVHEMIKNDLQDFIQLKTQVPPNQPAMPVRWIDGIVFQFGGYNPTDEIINDNLQGVVHWSIFEFAEMSH